MSSYAHASTSSIHSSRPQRPQRDSDDDDALLEELEEELDNDFDLGGFRERRMMELKAQLDAAQRSHSTGYGKLTEYKVEKDLIAATAKAKRSVIHFFHRDFRRCKIMDSHLEKLAEKYTDTLFVKVDVANAPFLVTKLEVKVLPCVIGFVDAVSKMKLVGFDELDGGDNFNTAQLEVGMVQCGVLPRQPSSSNSHLASVVSARSSGRGGGRAKMRSGGGSTGDDYDLDD